MTKSVQAVIQKRRSIRKYKSDPVPREVALELIEAARLAPSGCNIQGARYKIVDSKEEINLLMREKIFPQEFVGTAPLIIFCGYDTSAYPSQSVEGDDAIFGTNHLVRGVRDLGIASSFIVLRAEEMGLGTCYIGWMDKKKAKIVLKINDKIEILFAITVGYPAEFPPARPRKKMAEILI